jgi:hypothetical protein
MQIRNVIGAPTEAMLILANTIEATFPALGAEFKNTQLRRIYETILYNIKLEVEDYLEAPMPITELTKTCYSQDLKQIEDTLGFNIVHENISAIYRDISVMVSEYLPTGNLELSGVEDGGIVFVYTAL